MTPARGAVAHRRGRARSAERPPSRGAGLRPRPPSRESSRSPTSTPTPSGGLTSRRSFREVLDGTLLSAAPGRAGRRSPPPARPPSHEKLGRDEDAYQTLVAADRLHRGHLLIKLALGENRYKARRWREAALHLAPLAGHDEDAPLYPSEVAQACTTPRSPRSARCGPEKAPPLYARAAGSSSRPRCPALQALAEVAMEPRRTTGAPPTS